MSLATQDRWRPNADCVTCPYGDGIAILDLTSNTYFSVNDVGARVWQLLADGVATPGIIAAIARDYDVPEAQCAADIDSLIRGFAANGLIGAA